MPRDPVQPTSTLALAGDLLREYAQAKPSTESDEAFKRIFHQIVSTWADRYSKQDSKPSPDHELLVATSLLQQRGDLLLLKLEFVQHLAGNASFLFSWLVSSTISVINGLCTQNDTRQSIFAAEKLVIQCFASVKKNQDHTAQSLQLFIRGGLETLLNQLLDSPDPLLINNEQKFPLRLTLVPGLPESFTLIIKSREDSRNLASSIANILLNDETHCSREFIYDSLHAQLTTSRKPDEPPAKIRRISTIRIAEGSISLGNARLNAASELKEYKQVADVLRDFTNEQSMLCPGLGAIDSILETEDDYYLDTCDVADTTADMPPYLVSTDRNKSFTAPQFVPHQLLKSLNASPALLEIGKEDKEGWFTVEALFKMLISDVDDKQAAIIYKCLGFMACGVTSKLHYNAQHYPHCSVCDNETVSDSSHLPPKRLPHDEKWRSGLEALFKHLQQYPKSHQHYHLLSLALRRIATHISFSSTVALLKKDNHRESALSSWLISQLRGKSHTARLAAGQAVIAFAKNIAEDHRRRAQKTKSPPHRYRELLGGVLQTLDSLVQAGAKASHQETAAITLGELGCILENEDLAGVLKSLCRLFGQSAPAVTLAYTAINNIGTCRNVHTFQLFSPLFHSIAPFLAEFMEINSLMISNLLRCLRLNSEPFYTMTAQWTLPVLVFKNSRKTIDIIAKHHGSTMTELCMDFAPAILVFLLCKPDQQCQLGLNHLVNIVKSGNASGTQYGRKDLILVQLDGLLYNILLEMTDPSKVKVATDALEWVDREINGLLSSRNENDAKDPIGTFLTKHALGIVAKAVMALGNVQMKQSMAEKERAILSIKCLIERVGPRINTVTPQIMTALQSTLNIEPLCTATLECWEVLFKDYKFSDIGPFIASTSAAFVQSYPKFNLAQRTLAKKILSSIVDVFDQFREFQHTFANLASIPDLQPLQAKIRSKYKPSDVFCALDNLMGRINSDNENVCIRALDELRVLLEEQGKMEGILVKGDSFIPIISQLLSVLLATPSRMAEKDIQASDLAFECIGLIGALDPDRLALKTSDNFLFIMHNYQDVPLSKDNTKKTGRQEAYEFADFLLESVLLNPFRATSDGKHQNALAYCVKKLLNFCKYRFDIVNGISSTGSVASAQAALARWNALSKPAKDAFTPLLNANFELDAGIVSPPQYPICKDVTSYQRWLQIWLQDLLQNLYGDMAISIFEPFRSVVKVCDIGVMQALLPHLVLHVVISPHDIGSQGEQARQNIEIEIKAVLHNQINPVNGMTKEARILCSQTVFTLLDHFGNWLQRKRVKITGKWSTVRKSKLAEQPGLVVAHAATEIVGNFIRTPAADLVVESALGCRSFARALLNLENKICSLAQDQKRPNALDLQHSYERLHELYAELDEPDGMEGVSTKILKPDLQHQIREHEMTGRWTAAQSCWEIEVQNHPKEVRAQIGLLRCLRNLGHYESMRELIIGLQHQQPAWQAQIAPFAVECAYAIGDSAALEAALKIETTPSSETAFGRLFQAIQAKNDSAFKQAMLEARRIVGLPITFSRPASYQSVYECVVNLHKIRELEMIKRARESDTDVWKVLSKPLEVRYDNLSTTFKIREPVLAMRRIALKQSYGRTLESQIGNLWVTSSKIAMKSGHYSSAHSALLQAVHHDSPIAYLQSAKLSQVHGETVKAVRELDYALETPLRGDWRTDVKQMKDTDELKNWLEARGGQTTAKAALMRARWMQESGRFEPNEIVKNFKNTILLAPSWESAHYYCGRYYDQQSLNRPRPTTQATEEEIIGYYQHTVRNYVDALKHGTKFVYQALPRLLTIWLDVGDHVHVPVKRKRESIANTHERPDAWKSEACVKQFNNIHRSIKECMSSFHAWLFMAVFPQLVSRICHRNERVYSYLEKIISTTIVAYPHQSLWLMMSAANSKKLRHRRAEAIFTAAVTRYQAMAEEKAKDQQADPKKQQKEVPKSKEFNMQQQINNMKHLTAALLEISDYKLDSKGADGRPLTRLSMATHFPQVARQVPSWKTILIPTQSNMEVDFSTFNALHPSDFQPFPGNCVTITGFEDQITIMSSLVRPRKISIKGSDGLKYPFLCKPADDLRKDARLMEFNSVINKLLKRNADSRRRNLCIRTYSVVPLNETCGIIQWLSNLQGLRGILLKLYERFEVKTWDAEIKDKYASLRNEPRSEVGAKFQQFFYRHFKPVFRHWFLESFPEPSSWLQARLKYARTAAVISMCGFILGLGDRHGENINVDAVTGETVHVDFNCLFDKGRTFEVPERVPFRLTQNVVDGLGVTGPEGVFRKASEITMSIMRTSKDSLVNVVESFVHDPLIEWSKPRKASNPAPGSEEDAEHLRTEARKVLTPIREKLMGLRAKSGDTKPGDREISVENQVDSLLREAQDLNNLALMYIGWASYF